MNVLIGIAAKSVWDTIPKPNTATDDTPPNIDADPHAYFDHVGLCLVGLSHFHRAPLCIQRSARKSKNSMVCLQFGAANSRESLQRLLRVPGSTGCLDPRRTLR